MGQPLMPKQVLVLDVGFRASRVGARVLLLLGLATPLDMLGHCSHRGENSRASLRALVGSRCRFPTASLVDHQVPVCREDLVAAQTFYFLLSRLVDEDMLGQGITCRETLSTLSTLVTCFPCVLGHMHLQLFLGPKLPQTLRAGMGIRSHNQGGPPVGTGHRDAPGRCSRGSLLISRGRHLWLSWPGLRIRFRI